MHDKIAKFPVYAALVIIISAMALAGCSSSSTSSSTPSSTQQPAAQTQQSGQQSGQQGGQQGSQQGQKHDGQDMQEMQTKLLTRVAEILGVSTESLTTAYQNAMQSVMGDKTPGQGGQGTPPEKPSGEGDQKPPEGGQPPTDGQGGQGGGHGGPDMSGVYSKVAEALGLTAEKVQAAFEQAQKELMPSGGSRQIE